MKPVLSRTLFAVLTLITFIFVVVGFFAGISLHQVGLCVVCALLALGFGFFLYNDVRYYINYFKTKK